MSRSAGRSALRNRAAAARLLRNVVLLFAQPHSPMLDDCQQAAQQEKSKAKVSDRPQCTAAQLLSTLAKTTACAHTQIAQGDKQPAACTPMPMLRHAHAFAQLPALRSARTPAAPTRAQWQPNMRPQGSESLCHVASSQRGAWRAILPRRERKVCKWTKQGAV